MTNLQDLRDIQERLFIETSDRQPTYLLHAQRGTYIKLSAPAYHLLRNLSAGVSVEALAERMTIQQGKTVQPSEVEAAVQHVMRNIAQIEAKGQQNPAGFWFRIGLIPARVVNLLARFLAVAFYRPVAIVLLLVIGAMSARFLPDLSASFFVADPRLLPVVLLFVVSVVVHELGHASACKYYGLEPSEIGFALYWIYPVFYSNVNAVWRLRRWQRVVVDLGGIYFQGLIAAVYMGLYLLTGWEPLRLALALILLGCLVTLNPILKFDGYWVLADALGVVNLWQQPKRIWRYLSARLRGRPAELLPWPRWLTSVLVFYTIATVGFWAYFAWLFARLLWAMLHNFPFVFWWAVSGALYPPHTLDRLPFLLFPMMTVTASALTLFFIVRILLRPVWGWLRQRWAGTTSSRQNSQQV